MQCDMDSQRLSAYLDGEVSDSEAHAIRAHLDRCVACQDELAQLQQLTHRIQESIRTTTVPEDLQEHILLAITELHQAVQARRVLLLYGCCLALVVAGVSWLAFSPLGNFVRLMLRLAFAAGHSALRLVATGGVVWPTVIVVLSILLGGASVTAVVRVLRSSEVTV
jgi:anti-sigma factor (TIGR02949 family)